jgi:hypothetical protein
MLSYFNPIHIATIYFPQVHFNSFAAMTHLCMLTGQYFVSLKQQLEETMHQKHVQKRLVLCNIQELYVAFCEKYPVVSTGFSKFAELILAGARETLRVCACVIHQNNTHGASSTPYS